VVAAIEDFVDFDPTAFVVTGAIDFWDVRWQELLVAAMEAFLAFGPTALLVVMDAED